MVSSNSNTSLPNNHQAIDTTPLRDKAVATMSIIVTLGVVGLAIAEPDYRPQFLVFAHTFLAAYGRMESGHSSSSKGKKNNNQFS